MISYTVGIFFVIFMYLILIHDRPHVSRKPQIEICTFLKKKTKLILKRIEPETLRRRTLAASKPIPSLNPSGFEISTFKYQHQLSFRFTTMFRYIKHISNWTIVHLTSLMAIKENITFFPLKLTMINIKNSIPN